jgi:hypothetical protein
MRAVVVFLAVACASCTFSHEFGRSDITIGPRRPTTQPSSQPCTRKATYIIYDNGSVQHVNP